MAKKEPEISSIMFRQIGDKIFLVGAWPERTEITHEVLGMVPKDLVKKEGDFILFNVANGSAKYRIGNYTTHGFIIDRHSWSTRKVKEINL